MENKKIRVLYFVDRMLKGGIQSLVFEIAKRINKDKFQLDFLLLDDGKKYELEEELKELGCKVYKLHGIWIRTPIDFLRYTNTLEDFFKKHNNYDIVHMHSSSKNYLILKKAKKYGIKTRIAHSHNIDFQTKNVFKKVIGNLFKFNLKKYATDYFACSELAGKWLFGNSITNNEKFKIIHNAIDFERFKFNTEVREKIRKENRIEKNEILIGHVGRFSNQKNHEFLIEIFKELKRLNSRYKLILIGTGENELKIKNIVKKLNLENDVIFAGFKNNVNEYMQAMDVFLLPSKYEGLPVVGIEAQAAGLPIFVSKDVITSELKITQLISFISLSKSAKEWATIIHNGNLVRKDSTEEFKIQKYFIEDTVKELEKIYTKER